MDRRHVDHLLDALIDGELPLWQELSVRLHLLRCHKCAEELAEARKITALARQWRSVKPSAGLADRIEKALRVRALLGPEPGALYSVRRLRVLAPVAVGAGIAAVLLVGLLAQRSPADDLHDTLAAMKQVHSARATGFFTSFREGGRGRRPTGFRFPVEYRYLAPDHFLRQMEAGPREAMTVPTATYINGRAGVLIAHTPTADVREPLSAAQIGRSLSGFDLFSPEALIRYAVQLPSSRIESGPTSGSSAGMIRFTATAGRPDDLSRWTFDVNERTHRVAWERYEYVAPQKTGEPPELLAAEELTHFDYGIPIDPSEFSPPPAQP